MKLSPSLVATVALFISCTATRTTEAREKTGNGGGVHVCHLPRGETTYEMYDLYEGRHPQVHAMRGSLLIGETADEILQRAYARVRPYAPSLAAKIEAAVRMVDAKLALENADVGEDRMPPTLDADIILVGDNCEYVQLANWNERIGRLIYKESLFNRLPPVQQAALRFHEAVYWLSRKYDRAIDSDETRRFVASVFYDQPIVTGIASGFQQSGISANGSISWTDPECFRYYEKPSPKRLFAEVELVDIASQKPIESKKIAKVREKSDLRVTRAFPQWEQTELNFISRESRSVAFSLGYAFGDLSHAVFTGWIPKDDWKVNFRVTVRSELCSETVTLLSSAKSQKSSLIQFRQ